MDIDAVTVFVKIVESGSFSGAARILKMPKTTVSAKIAALEKRLGVTLIQRTTRKLHVTEAGRVYFGHCALAISEIEKAESALVAAKEKPLGKLKVTSPADLGHSLLPRVVAEYGKRYPEVDLELLVTNRYVDLVGEGVDIAIRAGELRDSTLVARRFFDLHIGCYASPAYLKKHGQPRQPKDLSAHKILGHPVAGSGRTQMYSKMHSKHALQTIDLKPKILVDDFETIKVLTTMKEGIGILPSFLVTRELKNKELVPVLPDWKLGQGGLISFVYPGQKYSLPKVKSFIEIALEVLNKEQF
jgi:DNA-binding transcriptional LysR family regulator